MEDRCFTQSAVSKNTAAEAGVIHGDSAISLRLNDRASILQAELAAINIALEFAKECNMSTALIIHGLQISSFSHRHNHSKGQHRTHPEHSYHRVTPHIYPRDTLGASACRNSRK